MHHTRLGLFSGILLAVAGCGLALAQPVEDLLNPGETLAAVLPVVGSTPGNFGSYFKTAVQIHNPGTSTLTFRLVYHPSGRSGAPGDPSLTVSVLAESIMSFDDMLPAMGVPTGLGSLDVFVPAGSAAGAVAVVRVYNDAGAAGTSGFTEDFVSLDQAISAGQEAYMLSPPSFLRSRFNVGVRSLGQGATLHVTVRNRGGEVIRTLAKVYGPDYFEQTSVESFLGGPLTGNECLSIQVTAGSAVIYGATTDNLTNDPSYQRAQRLID